VNDMLSGSDRPVSEPTRSGVLRRMVESTARGLLYCAVLVPLGVASLVAAPLGGARVVAGWWRGLRTGLLGRPSVPSGRPATVAVVGHALASVLLGVAAVPALGTQVLMVVRGVLYGFVDRGPYATSWGGPTRAGAWVVHFLVGVPFTVAGLAALVGIAAAHQRLTRALDGGRLAGWVVPVTLVLAVLAVVLIVAWTRQL
jgi:hypothetical protein